MTQPASGTKRWTKPELKLLGKLVDVANSQGAGSQGNSAKT